MSEHFETAPEAKQYAENAEEYRRYLEAKSVKGLTGQAIVALEDMGRPRLPAVVSRDELLQICLDRYFPHLAEAINVLCPIPAKWSA